MEESTSDDSFERGENLVTDQGERSAAALSLGPLTRLGSALLLGLRELRARLWASLWLIVTVAVIMTSLVVVAHLSHTFAIAAFLGFVASVGLLPRQEAEEIEVAGPSHPSMAARAVAQMQLVTDALPDPAILLDVTGQVLFCNTPARGLFASLRE